MLKCYPCLRNEVLTMSREGHSCKHMRGHMSPVPIFQSISLYFKSLLLFATPVATSQLSIVIERKLSLMKELSYEFYRWFLLICYPCRHHSRSLRATQDLHVPDDGSRGPIDSTGNHALRKIFTVVVSLSAGTPQCQKIRYGH
jgi:hypothetical protein